MCRLLFKTQTTKEELPKFTEALMSMKHGGPDRSGILYEDEIAMGHNRLSIIDLSHKSDQPMTKENVTILFNGEIYNWKELDSDLPEDERHDSPQPSGDTEALLDGYIRKGDSIFEELDGEFAILIYDRRSNQIKMVRDRSGVKPLYYSTENGFMASSEMRGILPFIDKELNLRAVRHWLTWGFSLEECMFKGIKKLLPGEIRIYNLESRDFSRYDRLDDAKSNPGKDLIFDLRDAIKESVKKRMMSDVPISCTLSGGLDSSIVTYLAVENSKEQIKTYTIGFEGCENEFEEARKVSDYLGTDHLEIEIEFNSIIDNIDDILDTMEEPIDRGSLIPTYFLAIHIGEKVTLIGEGSDECFAGYKRHRDIGKLEFPEYFEKHLRAMKTDEKPYFDIEEPNDFLRVDLAYEIPYYHTLRIDKCMMSFGIEARVPFLDPLVVETAMDISMSWKNDPEKKCLREAFRGELPDEILDRDKKALKIPFDKLIALPEIKEVIDRCEILREHTKYYYENFNEHGRDRNLWNIFLFQKWYEKHFPRT